PLRIVEVGDRENTDARLPCLGPQKLADIQRITREPRLESRRCQQIIQRHGQLESILGRIERFQVQNADLLHRRLLDLRDQCRKIRVFSLAPVEVEQVREQHVLATLHGIRGYPYQPQQG